MNVFVWSLVFWKHGIATDCDACGADAEYSETITTVSGYKKRTVTTNSCPNHYSYCTGKDGVSGCGAIGEEGSDTEALVASTSYEIPAEPVLQTTGAVTDTACETGAIAFALNGVAFYSGAVDSMCTLLDVDDDTSEWTAFDFCSGHSTGDGNYHYHFPPSCLITQAMESEGKSTSDHSPQIGWAMDGFPIYGPRGSGGNMMSNSESCTGSYCLDECSGREEEMPSVDDFKYRYYVTGTIGDLTSLPSSPTPSADDYPFTLLCYKGCQWADLISGSCTGDTGVTDSYSATALTGYTTKYVAANNRLCGSGETSDDTSTGDASNNDASDTTTTPEGFSSGTPGRTWMRVLMWICGCLQLSSVFFSHL